MHRQTAGLRVQLLDPLQASMQLRIGLLTLFEWFDAEQFIGARIACKNTI